MTSSRQTARSESIDLEELASALTTEGLQLDDLAQHVAVALYRLLAEGEPVSRARLARRTGLALDQISELLDSWFGVFYDEEERVIAFWGLALPEMAVGFEVDGNGLHTWCAWDSLFLPQILGTTARVAATAPDGTSISLTATPAGICDIAPSGTVLSFIRPEDGFDESVIQSFCHHVLFFPSEQAAGVWAAERPDAFVLTPEQGFELGRIWIEKRLGRGLERSDAATAGRNAA